MDEWTLLGSAPAQKPKTIADQIAATLREAIVADVLPGGMALRQDELAARFGFSRMPVRDALRLLETEGLVTIHPTKGAFVAMMDSREIREIYAIRELIEAQALRLSCARLSDAELDAAGEILDQMDMESNSARWSPLNGLFHKTLYARCDNERLLGLIEAHYNASDRYVRILLSDRPYHYRSQVEHRDLLAACRARDGERAALILAAHIREASRTLHDSFESLKATVRETPAGRPNR